MGARAAGLVWSVAAGLVEGRQLQSHDDPVPNQTADPLSKSTTTITKQSLSRNRTGLAP